VNLAMTRLRGRAPRGERVVESVPRNYGPQTSLIGALSLSGVEAVMTLEGAVDTEAFDAYVGHVLRPTIKRGAVLVLDNLSAHHASRIEEVAAECGASVIWLSPYSPAFSPIELRWSKIKGGDARGQSQDARRVGAGLSGGARTRHRVGLLRLVRALRLSGYTQSQLAIKCKYRAARTCVALPAGGRVFRA
jgi:transposase